MLNFTLPLNEFFPQVVEQYCCSIKHDVRVVRILKVLVSDGRYFEGAVPSQKVLYRRPHERMMHNQCYANSYCVARTSCGGFTYYEGYYRPEKTESFMNHAWAVTPGGDVMDITMERNHQYYRFAGSIDKFISKGEYFGIPVPLTAFDALPVKPMPNWYSCSILANYLLNEAQIGVPKTFCVCWECSKENGLNSGSNLHTK